MWKLRNVDHDLLKGQDLLFNTERKYLCLFSQNNLLTPKQLPHTHRHTHSPTGTLIVTLQNMKVRSEDDDAT